MGRIVHVLLLFSLLATAPSFVEAAQKRKASTGRPKTADLTFQELEIPPGTVERFEPGNTGGLATKRVAPTVPPAEKGRPMRGDVFVVLLVGEDGKVIDARAKSGPLVFAREAVIAAKQWEFQPLLVDGKPKKLLVKITFRFNSR